jgi:glucose/arabinose dehydrogenase
MLRRGQRISPPRRCGNVRAFPILVVLGLLAGCTGGSPGTTPSPPSSSDGGGPRDVPAVRLEPLLSGSESPLQFIDRGDGAFFVVEQAGQVRLWRDGEFQATAFLDLRGQISSGGEQGLLGFALDPQYASNGRFYVDYTDRNGDTQVVRYLRSALDGDRADPLSARTILTVDQPEANHNGGLVVFGPDGMLYVGLGDGGGGGDRHGPEGNGQNKDTLLGKILRIDVSGDTYSVPPDNPFATGGGRGEIWAYGLRNPWRFSFDRTTGDLYIGDVGQNRMEEIDYAPHTSRGGENYGWNLFEGSTRFRAGEADNLVPPVAEYEHENGRLSVIGGYVYRGEAFPALEGIYFYGDFGSGTLWGLWPEEGQWTSRVLLETGINISSFAQDHDGELYVVDIGGRVLKLVA